MMTIGDAMNEACIALGIQPPRRAPVPGKWIRTDTLERNGKGDAEVMLHDDRGGVSAVNWQTSQRKTIRLNGAATSTGSARQRDPERDRQEREQRATAARVCDAIVKSCRHEPHAYLARKGFPEELSLVHEDPRQCLPRGEMGDAIGRAMPEPSGPLLIVPGRIGGQITTVQFIPAEGQKKNILWGAMSGSCHRIATGRETWVCEGIATALSVRAALRLLGRSATVLSAFAASNVATVAKGLHGAVIAADNDKPLPQLHDIGTGEFYARGTGRRWVMPPELGDWNDHHQAHGLRAVALLLREVPSG